MFKEALEEVTSRQGFGLVQKIANGIVYTAYTKMIAGETTQVDKVAYCKGVIGAIKMLFLNIEESTDFCNTFIDEYKEEEEDDGNETVS